MIGEVRLFGMDWCPRGWARADGQLLPIDQYTSLYSLFGTTYGGDGRTSFGLPDLRGRAPIHQGRGPGLSEFQMGQKGGVEWVRLMRNQLPSHDPEGIARNSMGKTHLVTAEQSGENTISVSSAESNYGEVQPHENRSPYLAMNYCVALEGIYPSRN